MITIGQLLVSLMQTNLNELQLVQCKLIKFTNYYY